MWQLTKYGGNCIIKLGDFPKYMKLILKSIEKIPIDTYSLYWVLNDQGIGKAEDCANYLKGILEEFPHWKGSESHERKVKQELVRVLVKSGMKDAHKTMEIAQHVIRVIKGGEE